MRFKVRSNYRTHILSASHDIHKSKMCENCLLLSLCIRTLFKALYIYFPYSYYNPVYCYYTYFTDGNTKA